jgi:hypothetical protein
MSVSVRDGVLEITGVGGFTHIISSVGGSFPVPSVQLENLDSVKSLGRLRSVEGVLDLTEFINLESLGDLKYVEKAIIMPCGTVYRSVEEYKSSVTKFMSNLSMEDTALHITHKDPIIRKRVLEFMETGVNEDHKTIKPEKPVLSEEDKLSGIGRYRIIQSNVNPDSTECGHEVFTDKSFDEYICMADEIAEVNTFLDDRGVAREHADGLKLSTLGRLKKLIEFYKGGSGED